MMTNFEQAIVQSIAAFIVLLAFVVTASMLLLTLIESYLVVGGGVILLGLERTDSPPLRPKATLAMSSASVSDSFFSTLCLP